MAENQGDLIFAWSTITDILSPEKQVAGEKDSCFPARVKDLDQALNTMDEHKILHRVPAWFFQTLKDDLRRRVVPRFWQHFQTSSEPSTKSSSSDFSACLAESVNYLYEITQSVMPGLKYIDTLQRRLASKQSSNTCNSRSQNMVCGGLGVDTSLENQLIILYKSFLFFTFPKCFKDAVEEFYSQAFNAFHKSIGDEEENAESSTVENELSSEEVLDRFTKVNRKLDELGVLEHVSGSTVTSLIHDQIRRHIHATCQSSFETSYMRPLEQWLDTKVLNWLKLIYAGNHSVERNQSISAFRDRLLHFMCETYAGTLIDQLFNIIIEFPESEPAVLDLRVCLEKTDLRPHLVSSLRHAFESRLLHPGVNTSDILTAYISAIRALRVLDPPGVILELVCEPVRKYLRSRDDTVRCIVSSLTDDGSNELLDELIKGAPLSTDDGGQSDDESEAWENWIPDPVDANPETASKRRQASDIISTLVNVYGSQELFVAEYRTLLADRLLAHANTNAISTAASSTSLAVTGSGAGGELERELRYLELLKLRFGEAALHSCQVMLKDVADSRRINARIAEVVLQNGKRPDIDVTAMILSAQFWPSFREEKITLPEELQKYLDVYTQQYETLKGNRTLSWKPHLGLMNIDIELKDQTLNFTVSPVHAAIIMQFQEQDRWTVDDLGRALEMAPSAVRRKLAYWQGQGLVKEETPDVFVLVQDRRPGTHDVLTTEDDEQESAMASAAQQREEEMQTFWTYIKGMLQNLDCLPLERIYSMLQMFAIQGPESGEFTQAHLKAFLDRKVKEQQLIQGGGVYRLPKH